MTCTKPIRVNGLLVPCRHCLACRIAHTREWTVRMMHELEYWDESSFTTLTYNDENVPLDLSVHKRDLQLFFKRFRKLILPRRCMYYAVSEYGGRFGRPHYHIILFGYRAESRNDSLLLTAWPYGFNYSGSVTHHSIQYVAKYCIDKLSGPMARDEYGDREPPFQLQSKGIGRRWMEDHKEALLAGKDFTHFGVPDGLPAYYRRKLDLKQVCVDKARRLVYAKVKDILDHVDPNLAARDKSFEVKRIQVLDRDQRDIDNLTLRNNRLDSFSKT